LSGLQRKIRPLNSTKTLKKEPHVKRLTYGTEFLHQGVIETSEMSVLERLHNRTRQGHGARLNGIVFVLRAFKIDLGKYIEGMFGVLIVSVT